MCLTDQEDPEGPPFTKTVRHSLEKGAGISEKLHSGCGLWPGSIVQRHCLGVKLPNVTKKMGSRMGLSSCTYC